LAREAKKKESFVEKENDNLASNKKRAQSMSKNMHNS
jgi:hypothetical protein